jgi:hypothetical protein
MTDAAVDRPTDATGRAATPDALPYTLQFVEATRVALPALQSFVLAPAPGGQWFVVGGRRLQGLHTFQQRGSNFPRELSDHCLWLLDPATGMATAFETAQLPKGLAAALQATNQQGYYDRATDHLYIAGGYGWGADGRTMITFGTLIRVHVAAVVEEMQKPQPDPHRIAACCELGQDERFAVTGGSLLRLGDRFCLLFGQSFEGEYRAFGGGSFTQRYTEAARMFTLHPRSLEILAYGELTSGDLDRPFHRRDGNFLASVDPTTGRPCLTAFGGVFRTGAIAGFTHPIRFDDDGTFDVDRRTSQLFNQYTCPVVPIYDPRDRSIHHTFFGGISHHYHHETAEQARVREQVTQQGRNDGLPFVADVTTLVERDGVWREFVLPEPTPGHRLVGTSAVFVPDPDLVADRRFENDVFRLDGFTPGERVRLGHVYGGIEADFPYPLIPNHGTAATNAIFEVHLDYVPSAGIPAGAAVG